jgi:hypothetical protein
VQLPLTLVPGRYLIFCEVPASGDGKPHYRHGMFRDLVVSEAKH